MQRYNQQLLGLARSPVDGSRYILYNPAVRRTWRAGGPPSSSGYALADRLGAVLRRSRAGLLLASGVFDSVGGYGADRVLAERLALPPGRVDRRLSRRTHALPRRRQPRRISASPLGLRGARWRHFTGHAHMTQDKDGVRAAARAIGSGCRW
jgi:hypothetical protein